MAAPSNCQNWRRSGTADNRQTLSYALVFYYGERSRMLLSKIIYYVCFFGTALFTVFAAHTVLASIY